MEPLLFYQSLSVGLQDQLGPNQFFFWSSFLPSGHKTQFTEHSGSPSSEGFPVTTKDTALK